MEFYTTTELIDELAKRPLFAGLVIQANKELKNTIPVHKKWDITHCNMSAKQIYDLLEFVREHFRQLAEKE